MKSRNTKERDIEQEKALRLRIGIAGLTIAVGMMFGADAIAADGSAAPTTEFIFEETVLLGPSIPVGKTPFGDRNIVPIIGGTFAGPGIKGTIVPGGWDWQLTTVVGCFKLQADYMIRTDDGAVINVVNKGTSCGDLAKPGERIITVPVFEAPVGRYAWLNSGAYLGTLDVLQLEGKPAVKIRFFKAR